MSVEDVMEKDISELRVRQEGIIRMSKEVKHRLDESGANYKSGEHLVRFLVG